jgi:serine phosphatase RsbU (regulator of sigma subunit)
VIVGYGVSSTLIHLAPSIYVCSCNKLERVGGDWLGVDIGGDETLWIIVADVTGHGFAAYLLANGLPYLWRTTHLAERRALGCAPRDLLKTLGKELESALPDDVFVEAAVGRFTPAGEATVAGAGVCRVILRQSGQGMPSLYNLGGPLLGCEWGSRDQQDWALGMDDEFAMASDGPYEQPDGSDQQLKANLTRRAGHYLSTGLSLHEAIVNCMTDALNRQQQRDDITVVTMHLLSRLDESSAGSCPSE